MGPENKPFCGWGVIYVFCRWKADDSRPLTGASCAQCEWRVPWGEAFGGISQNPSCPHPGILEQREKQSAIFPLQGTNTLTSFNHRNKTEKGMTSLSMGFWTQVSIWVVSLILKVLLYHAPTCGSQTQKVLEVDAYVLQAL